MTFTSVITTAILTCRVVGFTMSLRRLSLVFVWCFFLVSSSSSANTSGAPRYPAFPVQFTANYSDNYGATAQVFVASTRSETGRFLARIEYDMVLKQVETEAGTSRYGMCVLYDLQCCLGSCFVELCLGQYTTLTGLVMHAYCNQYSLV